MGNERESYLVIGGCGFLGKCIVDMLLERGELEVSVFDLVQREVDKRARFFSGDICDRVMLEDVLKKTKTTCVIHTASPIHGLSPSIYQRVNVEGTRAVIDACQSVGVRSLVYTSSAGVVFDGGDLINADERLPYPPVPFDAYNETKASAEKMVLEANGTENGDEKGCLRTVALRPAGIFGPGDRQLVSHMVDVIKSRRTHYQLGDNTNLFDWTYVANAAHAHLLAADKLFALTSLPPTAMSALSDEEKEELSSRPIGEVHATLPHRRLPTSLARPLGPAVYKTSELEEMHELFYSSDKLTQMDIDSAPVARSRYDQFATNNLKEDESTLDVAGQAFFITNGEPIYFWDFFRSLWRALGHISEKGTITLPKSVALSLASCMEWAAWALRMDEPTFTRFRVRFATTTRWHNIEKARRVLGYEPLVGVEEGVRRTAKWWEEVGSKI